MSCSMAEKAAARTPRINRVTLAPVANLEHLLPWPERLAPLVDGIGKGSAPGPETGGPLPFVPRIPGGVCGPVAEDYSKARRSSLDAGGRDHSGPERNSCAQKETHRTDSFRCDR